VPTEASAKAGPDRCRRRLGSSAWQRPCAAAISSIAGEAKEERLFIVRGGKIVWSYTHPEGVKSATPCVAQREHLVRPPVRHH